MDFIEALATDAPCVGPTVSCAEVYDIFSCNLDLLAIAVVDGDTPIGLVNRNELTLKLAERYGRPLYENRPVTRLMDPAPLMIEADHSIDFLSRFILDERPSALMQGFIVTKGGRYLGIGTALSMLQVSMVRSKQHSEELERARITAETANRTKSVFLANMSHELRTPLNAIIGFTDFMGSEALGRIEPRQYADYIKDVNESGKHLLNVINAILDMSKVEANRLDLLEDYVDPEQVVSAVCKMMESVADKKNLEIQIDCCHTLPDIFVDGQILRQILLNLLSNAVKFSGDSAIIKVQVSLLKDGSMCFSVIDKGIGIAAEDMSKVMEPFGQVDGYLSRQVEGTGLGLPLCKALTEAHGGILQLTSEPGQGTRANVILPPSRVVYSDTSTTMHKFA